MNSLWLWLQLLGDKEQRQLEPGTGGGTVSLVHLQTCHPYRREAGAEIRAACSESSQDSPELGAWQRLHGEGDGSRCHVSEQGTHPQRLATAFLCLLPPPRRAPLTDAEPLPSSAVFPSSSGAPGWRRW